MIIQLTQRQLEIIEWVKQYEPVTGDQIAESLGLSRPTIRSDLSVLVMLGLLDAKPKVGYFIGKNAEPGRNIGSRLNQLKVKDVQSVPVVVRETTSVQEAVATLFLENVGSLLVTDDQGILQGVVSRKDLLKVTLGNNNVETMPISMVMTRQPNIITVTPEEMIIEAARKMMYHQVDTLPVVEKKDSNGTLTIEVVGRITKTTMTKILLDLATETI